MICTCMQITEEELIDDIRENKLETVDEIGDENGAGTICGSCLYEINRILKNERVSE